MLARTHLGSGLDKDDLETLAAIAAFKTYHKDEIIFLEGDRADGFYILLTGQVKIYKSSPEGKEYTIHIIKPGQLFAEAAIFRGVNFPANCTAMETSQTTFFPKNKFINLLEKSPQMSLKIIASLSAFVRDFNRQVEELSLKEVPSRLASYILARAEEFDTDTITLDLTKTDLASRLGTISETLSRALKKFKAAGIIEVEKDKISIIDKNRLISASEGEKI